MIEIYKIKIKVYMLEDVSFNDIQKKITAFLDLSFLVDDELVKKHKENNYKWYTYDLLYPFEQDRVYKKDKIYTLTIRTVDRKLADFFLNKSINAYSNEMKGLTGKISIIPRKHIEQIYTLTPVVMKNEEGYWRRCMSLEKYEQRLKTNLIKKYNTFKGEKINENFELYNSIEFLNKKPVAIKYKNIKLLGDKIRLHIAENPTAQKIALLALGTGIGEMNARGFGFVNFKWL